VVSGEATLDALHRVLQVAMGWDNYHFHCFRIGGVRYGLADDEDFDLDEVDERTVTVAEAFSEMPKGFCDYDFGDSWHHERLVEKWDPITILLPSAVCTGGRRACPPEDCGGISCYVDLIDALSDPGHEEHAACLEWVGGDFDPEDFDLEAVNFGLRLLR
jgi:hypothetical protein